MMWIEETFGVRLEDARKSMGWTQKQLAEHCDMPEAQISHWECDRRLPSLPNLIILCDTLSVSADTLLGLESA